jgi:glycosyltransferase involved in cell wall biosynthesis
MRIVLDLQACQTEHYYSKTARHSLALTQALLRQGSAHDIRIALNGALTGRIDEIRGALTPFIDPACIMVFDVPAPVAVNNPANDWRRNAAEYIRENFLANMAPDVVHVAGLFDSFSHDVVAANSGGGLDVLNTGMLHGLSKFMAWGSALVDPLQRNWYYRKLQALKNTNLLLTLSTHARNEAIDLLGLAEDNVVSIGASAEYPKLAVDDHASILPIKELKQKLGISRKFVVFFCDTSVNTNLHDGVDHAIRAFGLLSPQLRREFQLAIVGGMDESARTRQAELAQRSGLQRNDLLFAGALGPQETDALLAGCTLAIISPQQEASELLALQAITSGTVVMGAANTVAAEMIGMPDALFEAADIRSMSHTMQRILLDAELHAALLAHNRKQAGTSSLDASAKCMLQAFEQRHDTALAQRHGTRRAGKAFARPRLAFISPLPPQRSGIADYSAQLLPELARHYAIELIVAQDIVKDDWLTANFPVRSAQWFDAHAHEFERVVYHFGNSGVHRYMFPLLERHSGIVVLHDFYLSGVLNSIDVDGTSPGSFPAELYKSHGFAAMIEERGSGRDPSVWKFPCNKSVLDFASGVITHSQFSRQLADAAYGPGTASDWETIPLLRKAPLNLDKATSRKRLGIDENAFILCSFGMVAATKLNDQLLTAWLASPMAQDERCMLIFVGDSDVSQYVEKFTATIKASACADRISVTGFTSAECYEDYLHAADMAVQLRSMTRGETSAAILDCLAYGVPTIINTNGSAAELPDQVALRLPDQFLQEELRAVLIRLHADATLRERHSSAARAHIKAFHHPANIGLQYRDAIERISASEKSKTYRTLIDQLANIDSAVPPEERDLVSAAASIACNRPRPAPRQIFIDISAVASVDIKTGIQRVVRSVLKVLLMRPPAGYRIEPVYHCGDYYAYARAFTATLFDLPPLPLEDAPIEAGSGDIFLGLDLFINGSYENQRLFERFRNHGVRIYFVVYDLLPLLRPDVFPPQTELHFGRWLEMVAKFSEGVACISHSVSIELASWIETLAPSRQTPLKIGFFHLGADINASVPSFGLPPEAEQVLEQVRMRPTILMVGTIEPRKGHAQALAAFELLWEQGIEVNLVIVGKNGWMVDKVISRLRKHSEAGKHLFWQEGVSDEMLMKLYDNASALLAASEGEGFGLPLIEAAQHGLPIIARGIPVFREVAQDHAFYFDGMSPAALATAVREWLLLHDTGKVPSSGGMAWLSWEQSADQLLQVIFPQETR